MQQLQNFIFYDTGSGIDIARINEAAKSGGFVGYDRKPGMPAARDVFWQPTFQELNPNTMGFIANEIKEAGLSEDFSKIVSSLFGEYHKLYDKLLPFMLEKHKDLASDKGGRVVVEGLAKEDARYIVPLATHTQMGMTANSRVLEMTIRRLAKSPIKEIQELAKNIYDATLPHAPSVIRYTKPTPYDTETEALIKKQINLKDTDKKSSDKGGRIRLLDYTDGGDKGLAESLIFTHTDLDYESIKEAVSRMSTEDIKSLVSASLAHMESYDRALREFEMITMTFEAVISASCFAQLKRHRMASILAQDYDLSLGIEVPPSIKEANLEGEFTDAAKISGEFYMKLKEKFPNVAPYILTNAHRRRVLIHLNLRELYHMSRIRMDETAQWDIRLLTSEMAGLATEVMPIGAMLLCAKDRFHDVKKDRISVPV